MRQTSRLSLFAGAAIAAVPVGSVFAADPQAWSNSDEVRALVSEMIADAESRSSLLQSGATAGHDGKFFLASSDGNYRLNIGGQIQFRYIASFRDDADGNDDGDAGFAPDDFKDGFEGGFQTRRTRLHFSGNAVDPNLFYFVQGEFDRDGGDFNLLDAYVGYDFDNGWSVRWGQFKLPFLREELILSSKQLAVERSLTNEVFNQDRSQGIEASYKDDSFRFAFAFSDGFASQDTDFTSSAAFSSGFQPAAGNEADWAFTARGAVLIAGDWDVFKDFTSAPGADYSMMLGFAGHIEGGEEYTTPATGFVDGAYFYASYTVDFSMEGDGWNAFIAFVGSHSEFDDVPDGLGGLDDVDFDDFGVVAQFGMFIPDTDWEPFLRYDAIFADDERPGLDSNNDTFSTITFGANYYHHGHASKFTADIVWFIDEANASTLPNTGVGFLTDDDSGEFAVRLQWQLLF